ncbi:MAG: TonB-dependent receptor [Bacteroidaceae bacterium]|nr:TonB-dependent receptor [Bacteroidaceae bacterium]
MVRKLTMLLACLTLGIGMAQAQMKVNGTVLSQEDNEPVIGASVLVVGTNVGTITDLDGRFSLTCPSDKATLRISFLGMESLEVAASPNMRILLTQDTETLDEVIIVGYGVQRREAKTGSITSVAAEQIKDIPILSVDKMLSGKLAGVQVTQSSGQPGSSTSIRIRGTSSINAGNNPLYVVDGIAVMSGDDSNMTNTSNPIAMINPNDIESITVLKDAAAASVYGSRAANGVILITTKSGKEGKSQFTARAKYGISQLANDNNYGVMTGQELLEYQRDAIRNAGKDPDNPQGGSTNYRPYELLTRDQTNWMDHFTRIGQQQEYEINMSGGSSKTKYYNSLSYNKTEGIYYGIDFSRMQARVNVDHEINKSLKTGTRINFGYTNSSDVPMQSLYYANPAFAGLTILPWSPAYDENGNHYTMISENSNTNPRATAQYDEQWAKRYSFNGSMYLEWSPIKQLTFKTTDAAEMSFIEDRRYWSNEAHNSAAGYPVLQAEQTQYRTLTTSNTATYQDIIGKNSIRALLGQEASHQYYWLFYEYAQSLNPQIPYLPSGSSDSMENDYDTSTETMMSFFGILDYSYDMRYYLQASIREDGSSLFGADNQWGLFWSVGASWNIHNEQFMQSATWLNTLKLRASYGVNGNNNISPYRQYGTYTSSSYNGVTGLRPSTPANSKLSWEKNYSWNVGLDFRFMKRFSGSVDLYTRKTTDMLLSKAQSSTSGFNSALTNIGSLQNSGVEFQFDADIIDSKDLKWSAGFNIAFNKSEILELAGDDEMVYADDSRLRHFVGERLFTFYLKDYYGVNPVNGEALWRNEDGELTNDYNAAAYIKAGSPEPVYTGGVNTTISWKGLSLSAVGEFKGGNKVLIVENRYLQADGNQMSMNQAKSALNYWKKPGDTGVAPKPISGNATNSYQFASTRWLEKGDYFRLKDITLSYNLPKEMISKAGLSATRLYASALNLYTFHDVNFWDPERGVTGMGTGIYPVSKSMVVGLEVTF